MTRRYTLTLLFIAIIIVGATALYLSLSSPNTNQNALLSQPRLSSGFRYNTIDQYCDQYQIDCRLVDRSSFTIMSDGLAYDEDNLYYLDQVIENRSNERTVRLAQLNFDLINRYQEATKGSDQSQWDLDSFQILDLEHGYARDQAHLYYAGYRVDNVDPSRVQLLGDNLYTDGDHLYSGLEKLAVDPHRFVQLNDDYYRDDQQIYYRTDLGFITALENAHPATFTLINRSFAKDIAHYYFNGIPLDHIDYKTFKPFRFHAVDKNRGYYFLNAVQLQIIPSIDYQSFVEIDNQYAKDNHYVYYRGERIPQADPNTFYLNDYGVGADQHGIYWGDYYLHNANPEHFQLIGNSGYAIDNQHLFYEKQIIFDADPDTFMLLAMDDALIGQDKNHCYSERKIIPCPIEPSQSGGEQ